MKELSLRWTVLAAVRLLIVEDTAVVSLSPS